MSLQNLLDQFIGSGGAESSSGNTAQNIGETFNKLSRLRNKFLNPPF